MRFYCTVVRHWYLQHFFVTQQLQNDCFAVAHAKQLHARYTVRKNDIILHSKEQMQTQTQLSMVRKFPLWQI